LFRNSFQLPLELDPILESILNAMKPLSTHPKIIKGSNEIISRGFQELKKIKILWARTCWRQTRKF